MNELSNTIELIPILTRAESLFHRFERTVQAIDKKSNFPAPSVRQRKPDSGTSIDDKGKSPQRTAATGASSSVDSVVARANGTDHDRVISPELRKLLSRDVITIEKNKPKKNGGEHS